MSASRISTKARISAEAAYDFEQLANELAALSAEVRRKGLAGLCLCDVARLGEALREYAVDADRIIKGAASK